MATAEPFRHVSYPLRVYAGENVISRLGEEADRAQAKRAFAVCGQTVANRTNILERVMEALGDRFAGVFDATQTGSPVPSVELAPGGISLKQLQRQRLAQVDHGRGK